MLTEWMSDTEFKLAMEDSFWLYQRYWLADWCQSKHDIDEIWSTRILALSNKLTAIFKKNSNTDEYQY